MFWLDFGARGSENIANSAVLFLVGTENTVNYNVLCSLWYLGVRSLWGRKSDHFLPHRELPNMKVAYSRKDGLVLIEDLMRVVISWGPVSVGQEKWPFSAPQTVSYEYLPPPPPPPPPTTTTTTTTATATATTTTTTTNTHTQTATTILCPGASPALRSPSICI